MSPKDREIVVRALAGNADPEDAELVLSQALEALRSEATLLRVGYDNNFELMTLLFSHENRLRALEELFDRHMVAKWRAATAKPEAAE